LYHFLLISLAYMFVTYISSTLLLVETHLNHLRPHLLSAFSHSDSHVTQQRWMANITGIAISLNITRPLESCGICMSCANVTCLKSFKLLLSAQLVCLWRVLNMVQKPSVEESKTERAYHFEPDLSSRY
jgi:hypothetical protein